MMEMRRKDEKWWRWKGNMKNDGDEKERWKMMEMGRKDEKWWRWEEKMKNDGDEKERWKWSGFTMGRQVRKGTLGEWRLTRKKNLSRPVVRAGQQTVGGPPGTGWHGGVLPTCHPVRRMRGTAQEVGYHVVGRVAIWSRDGRTGALRNYWIGDGRGGVKSTYWVLETGWSSQSPGLARGRCPLTARP